MAVDDVITDLSCVNTTLTFTPAAGVEVMIKSIPIAALVRGSGATGLVMMDTSLTSRTIPIALGLTNSFAVLLGAVVALQSWVSGIQTK